MTEFLKSLPSKELSCDAESEDSNDRRYEQIHGAVGRSLFRQSYGGHEYSHATHRDSQYSIRLYFVTIGRRQKIADFLSALIWMVAQSQLIGLFIANDNEVGAS